MPATPRACTADLNLLTGAPVPAGTVVSFRRRAMQGQAGSIVVPDTVTATADADGRIAVTLYPGEGTMQVRGTTLVWQADYALTEDGSTDLANCIGQAAPLLSNAAEVARDESIAARDAALVAETNAETAEVAAEAAQAAAAASATAAAGSATTATTQAGIATTKASEAAASAAAAAASLAALDVTNLAQTWNNGLTTFQGIKKNVTGAAFAAESDLLQLLMDGIERFSVHHTGAVAVTMPAITAIRPALDLSQIWNNAGVMFAASRIAVTDTASNAESELIRGEVGGVRRFGVRKDGWIKVPINSGIASFNGATEYPNTRVEVSGHIGRVRVYGDLFEIVNTLGQGVGLVVPSGHVLEQRSGVNPQAFRLYNTFTDAANFERGFMSWVSNVLRIGTEKAGTGVARAIEFQTDGVTRATIGSAGDLAVTGNVATLGGGGLAVVVSGTNPNAGRGLIATGFSGLNLLTMGVDWRLAWENGTIANTASVDLVLQRDAADTLAMYRGANPQRLNLYNTRTDGANFERGFVGWLSSEFRIGMDRAGTGANRGVRVLAPLYLNLEVAGVDRIGITPSLITASLPMQFPDGSQSTPSIRGGDADSGIFFSGNNIRFSSDGANRFSLDALCNINLSSLTSVRWTSSGSDPNAGHDLILLREAAGVLGQRNGLNPQSQLIYNTWTDAANFERGFMRWASNVLEIGTERAGTGSQRQLALLVNGTNYSFLSNAIFIIPDVGGLEFAARARISAPSLGIIRFTEHNGTGAAALELREMTAPATPATDHARFYLEDNGSGKSRAVIKWSDGSTSVIATQP